MDSIKAIDGQTGALFIILHLSQEAGNNMRQLIGRLNISQAAAYSSIETLIKHNLVEEKEEWGKDRRGGKRKNYYLTDKGKKVAEKLKEIEKIIEG